MCTGYKNFNFFVMVLTSQIPKKKLIQKQKTKQKKKRPQFKHLKQCSNKILLLLFIKNI